MKINAFVVDRRTIVRKALAQPLLNTGVHRVVEMNAKELATEPFEAGEFDVILIEFSALINAGETLLTSLRNQDSHVPIIVTYPPTTNVADLINYYPSATAFLKSPFTPEQLRELIDMQLQMLTA